MAKQPDEDPLVSAAFDKDKHADLAEAVQQLSPEEAQFFLDKLERALKRRRLLLVGYLVAMLAWATGMLIAFGASVVADKDTFIAWVFVVPFGVVGVILYIFGRWADRVGGKLPAKKR
jgi:hypothetical protein|nr:hypothetical protein [Kofleriaceae bacterium]